MNRFFTVVVALSSAYFIVGFLIISLEKANITLHVYSDNVSPLSIGVFDDELLPGYYVSNLELIGNDLKVSGNLRNPHKADVTEIHKNDILRIFEGGDNDKKLLAVFNVSDYISGSLAPNSVREIVLRTPATLMNGDSILVEYKRVDNFSEKITTDGWRDI